MAHICGESVGQVVKEGQTPIIPLFKKNVHKAAIYFLMFCFFVFVQDMAWHSLHIQTLAEFPISPLWSVLFFFMLFILGLDSQFTQLGEIVI